MEGTDVEAVMLFFVMWCQVVLCWSASYLDTVNRPTCRWTHTPKETHEVRDLKDER